MSVTDKRYTKEGYTHPDQTSPELEDHECGKERCRQLVNQNQALTNQSDQSFKEPIRSLQKSVINSLNRFTRETI